MKKQQVFLTKEGYQLLLEQCRSGRLSKFNKRQLMKELKNAYVVSKEYLPLNVITENVKVLLSNMRKGQTFSINIVKSAFQGISRKNTVLTTDPIAIALLGYAPGAVTEWELEDGINTLKVISVNT